MSSCCLKPCGRPIIFKGKARHLTGTCTAHHQGPGPPFISLTSSWVTAPQSHPSQHTGLFPPQRAQLSPASGPLHMLSLPLRCSSPSLQGWLLLIPILPQSLFLTRSSLITNPMLPSLVIFNSLFYCFTHVKYTEFLVLCWRTP